MKALNPLCLLFLLINTKTNFILSDEIVGWRDDYVQSCLDPHAQDYDGVDFVCLTYFWNYVNVNVELHCYVPVIIIYRAILSRAQVFAFLADIETKQRTHEVPADRKRPESYPKEIIMKHYEGDGTAAVFEKIQAMIPAINFTVSEPWQILSYTAGEHYPPRFDFLQNTSDPFTQLYGNRFATLMVMLKKPKEHGHTTFPAYNITVELEEGDAVLWTNMDGEGHKSVASIHGDCKVRSGEKVTASLRIRAKNQYLIKTSMFAGSYSVASLARPRLDIRERVAKA